MTKQEILNTIELRQSTLKSWLNCPLLYKFRHIDGLEPEFRYPAAIHGSALHLVLKWLHEGEWDGDLEKLYIKALNHYLYAEDDSHIPIRWKKDKESDIAALTRNAVEILENYRSKSYNRNAVVLFSEAQFRVSILGYLFTGTLDQVRKNEDGNIELLDFKSSVQRPNIYAVQNDLQLKLYAYALKYGELLADGIWVKANLLVDHSSIYFLRAHEVYKRKTAKAFPGDEKGDPFISYPLNLQMLRTFRQEIKAQLSAMLKPWYYPNTASCAFCAFKSHCISRDDNIPDRDIDAARVLLEAIEME